MCATWHQLSQHLLLHHERTLRLEDNAHLLKHDADNSRVNRHPFKGVTYNGSAETHAESIQYLAADL